MFPTKTLHLFDTFKGHVGSDPTKDPEHPEHTFNSVDEEDVRKLFHSLPGTQFHVGPFPETTKGLEATRFSFVHVDMDIYKPTLAACSFFFPRLLPNAVMVFDDFKGNCPGVKAAIKEALPGITLLFAKTPQAILLKE